MTKITKLAFKYLEIIFFITIKAKNPSPLFFLLGRIKAVGDHIFFDKKLTFHHSKLLFVI